MTQYEKDSAITIAIAPARIQTSKEAGPTNFDPIAVATYTSAPMIDPTTRLVTSNVLSFAAESTPSRSRRCNARQSALAS